MDTLSALPDFFAAGTTVKYSRSYSDFPANGGWTMKLYLAGAQTTNVSAVANGAGFDLTLTSILTAGLTPGVYRWIERVTNGTETYDPAQGTVTVKANVASATPGSLQTWEEQELPKVEQAITDLIASGVTSYQIGSRSLTKQDLTELYKLRASLRATIQAQQTGSATRKVPFAFTGTGFDR